MVSQFIFRLPWQIPLNSWLAPRLVGDEVATFGWVAVSSLTAGLFEETGRWFAYRWLWKDRSTLGGVMLGAGHGGIESVLLVGLSLIGSLVVYVALTHGSTLGIPAETMSLVEKQFGALTPVLASLGGVERVAAWGLHIGCSLLVTVTKSVGPVQAEVALVLGVSVLLILALRRSRRVEPLTA